jgi:hypothetical protein
MSTGAPAEVRGGARAGVLGGAWPCFTGGVGAAASGGARGGAQVESGRQRVGASWFWISRKYSYRSISIKYGKTKIESFHRIPESNTTLELDSTAAACVDIWRVALR